MADEKHTVYIGLGANLGDANKTIVEAVAAISALPTSKLVKSSALYQTAPVDASGNDYINAVIELETALSPSDILHALQSIEHDHGRVRPYSNAPRTLDCDVLLYDQRIIATAELVVPHPRMTQRAFVLVPLIEIAPEIHIPDQGKARDFLPLTEHQIIRKLVTSTS